MLNKILGMLLTEKSLAVIHQQQGNPYLNFIWWLLFVNPVPVLARRSWLSFLQPWLPHIDLAKLRWWDVPRIALQALWLVIFKPIYLANKVNKSDRKSQTKAQPVAHHKLNSVVTKFDHKFQHLLLKISKAVARSPRWLSTLWRRVIITSAAVLAWFCITTPFDLAAQSLFCLMLLLVAQWVVKMKGRFSTLLLVTLSFITTSRYMWWRCTSTLNWDETIDLALGLGLLAAEIYACLILILGYVQTMWPLKRKLAPLPKDNHHWPHIDVFIPTYNEPVSVIKPTIFAAQAMDWPSEKLHIYILDDGQRDSMRIFAEQNQVGYFIRPDNRHAKAGNINHALKLTNSEYVAIFDCDHIPTRSFMQLAMGWFFQDKKIALVQTPHHFFSADPFERNLDNFRDTPNENELFYGLSQDGNDLWDATFFCGSCAVLKRQALDEIGGIATETVTEDAHTALKLHRLGYGSAYINIPQAAGLATESLSAHVGQRIRWARGMAQIFRTDNPLLGKGLSFMQRLCYANAMLHFLYGLPRIVFLTAPLGFLIFHAYIIYAPALSIALYVLPHLIHANITNSRMQGQYRRSFYAEMYETVLAWYILRPTMVALFNPGKGKFNVTIKGGLIEDEHFDWSISRPYLIFVSLNLIGLVFACYRIAVGPENELFTVILNLCWTVYNLIILGGAVAVSAEVKQVRQTHRVEQHLDGALQTSDGRVHRCTLLDYSEGGCGLTLHNDEVLAKNHRVSLYLKLGLHEYAFPAQTLNQRGRNIGVKFHQLSAAQEKQLVQCTFSRADAWTNWHKNREHDQPLRSLAELMRLGWRGYQRLARLATPQRGPLVWLFKRGSNLAATIVWCLPRSPRIAVSPS